MKSYLAIMGRLEGNVEEIDRADDKDEARYLVQEYRMAFGPDWSIWYTRKFEKGESE